MSEHDFMRLAFVLLAALTLVSCGGSGTSTHSTSATSSAATTAAAAPTTTSGAVTVTKAAGSSSSTASSSRCRASGLALSYLGQQGATGHGEIGFALRNVATTACRTYGYPGIQFLDQAGAPLPTISTRTTHDFFGVAPAVPLLVAPGVSVSFRIGVTHGISSSAGCSTAYGLQVIPPDDTGVLRTTIPQGSYECRTATISPLRSGSSAYP